MDNSVIILEHVHLVNVLQLLHSEFLNRLLEFLVLIHFLMVHDLFGSSLTTFTADLRLAESGSELGSSILDFLILIHISL